MHPRLVHPTALAGSILALTAIGMAQITQVPADPTFSNDVAPILYKNCVSCHRPGQMAPMSLLTYEEARPYAKAIREKVAAGQMPPWHADAPAGTFLNDRRLSDAEKDTILQWASSGALRGETCLLPCVS